MRQLFVAHGFAPLASAEAFLNIKYLKYIINSGWETDLLTVDHNYCSSRYDAFLDGQLWHIGIRKRFYFKSSENSLGYRALYRFSPFFRTIPDETISWALQSINGLNLEEYDLLHSSSSPLSSHVLGYRIWKRRKMPWLVHFSDPWLGNPYLKRGGLSRYVNRLLERNVLKNADAINVTNKETHDLFTDRYPAKWCNKIIVIPHGFEASWYPREALHRHQNKIILRYIGQFYGPRKPFVLIKAFEDFAKRFPEKADCFKIEFYGPVDFDPNTYTGSKWPRNVAFMGEVDYLSSLELMKTSDMLLLIDAPAEKNLFLPSKLIDYLGAERPIWAITPSTGPSATLLGKIQGVYFNLPQDQDGLAATFIKIHDDHQRGPLKIKAPAELIQKYNASNVAGQILDQMNRISGKKE